MSGPRYPAIHVAVADGAPRIEIIARVMKALPKDARAQFTLYLPRGYAMTVEYIREWVGTD